MASEFIYIVLKLKIFYYKIKCFLSSLSSFGSRHRFAYKVIIIKCLKEFKVDCVWGDRELILWFLLVLSSLNHVILGDSLRWSHEGHLSTIV